MRRGLLVAAIVATALTAPQAAHAEYYMSKKQAVHATRNYLHWTLGYHYTAAVCRPQYLEREKPGYVYHRWVCAWAAGDDPDAPDCSGRSRARGSSSKGQFYWFVLAHSGDCQYGVDS